MMMKNVASWNILALDEPSFFLQQQGLEIRSLTSFKIMSFDLAIQYCVGIYSHKSQIDYRTRATITHSWLETALEY